VKVFVSGLSGFVGGRLAERLAGAHRVCGCVHRHPPWSLPPEAVAAPALDLGADPAALADLLEALDPDAVVHCAAISRPAEAAADPARAWRVNVESGRAAAAWCRRRGRPLIAFSSDTVYADAAAVPAPPGGWRESDPPGPASEYARGKPALEAALEETCPAATRLRCSLVYGRGPAGGNSFSGWLAARLAGPEPVPVFRDNRRHAIAAAQLADAVEALLARPLAGPLNLGGADHASREELARRWCAATGADPARLRPLDQADAALPDALARELPLNLERLAGLLGRRPGGLDAGLAREAG